MSLCVGRANRWGVRELATALLVRCIWRLTVCNDYGTLRIYMLQRCRL